MWSEDIQQIHIKETLDLVFSKWKIAQELSIKTKEQGDRQEKTSSVFNDTLDLYS